MFSSYLVLLILFASIDLFSCSSRDPLHGSIPGGERIHPMRTLVLVDGFTDYISGIARQYCKTHDINVVDVVSPYLAAAIAAQGNILPISLLTPTAETADQWLEATNLLNSLEDKDSTIFCLSESDCGVQTAEYLSQLLNLPSLNAPMQEVQNKYTINLKAAAQGISVVNQAMVNSWEEARLFLNELWLYKDKYQCVIKPYRGVASDGVALCEGLGQAHAAFHALLKRPRYGGGLNEAVLIQEYAEGQEYAVDTVVSSSTSKQRFMPVGAGILLPSNTLNLFN